MTDPKPVRLQLSRRKGFKLVSPNGLPVVKVDRTTKWGNPYKVKDFKSVQDCIACFRYRMESNRWTWPNKWQIREELCGKNLACWCRLNQPCHADVLLEIANG